MSLLFLAEAQRRGLHSHQQRGGVSGRHWCSSRRCLQAPMLAVALWSGTCPPPAPEAESHGGIPAPQVGAESTAWHADKQLNQGHVPWGLEGGRRGMPQFGGTGAAGGPSGPLLLSIVWVTVPAPNRSIGCMLRALFS